MKNENEVDQSSINVVNKHRYWTNWCYLNYALISYNNNYRRNITHHDFYFKTINSKIYIK